MRRLYDTAGVAHNAAVMAVRRGFNSHKAVGPTPEEFLKKKFKENPNFWCPVWRMRLLEHECEIIRTKNPTTCEKCVSGRGLT